MFRGIRNAAKNGPTLRDALAGLRRRLPPAWTAEADRGPRGAVVRLSGPDVRCVELEVVLCKTMLPRDVYALLAGSSGPALLVAPFASARGS